ncbi:MAG: phage tail protein [Novosphingobium sp.]|nr:phage tail protein [Novosphingobium sp.]
MPMMSFGMFQFEIGTLPYQELSRSRGWRYGRAPALGARDASQYLGPDADVITLTGALIPGLAGSFSSLEELVAIGDRGQACKLVDGLGNVLGSFELEKLDHKASTFMVDGLARKGDFTITLTRARDPEEIAAAALGLTTGG